MCVIVLQCTIAISVYATSPVKCYVVMVCIWELSVLPPLEFYILRQRFKVD